HFRLKAGAAERPKVPVPVGGHDRLQGGSDVATVGFNQAARSTPAGSLPASMVPHPREELFSVLVVDDHPLLREAISARLAQMGAGTVHEAATVAEARLRRSEEHTSELQSRENLVCRLL